MPHSTIPAGSCQVPSPQSFPDPIPDILPFGTVTIFAGAPGVGKTAMIAEWIRRWRDGRTICGKPTCAPTEVYYLAADRQWASHRIWFEAVGITDIKHYSLADDPELDLNKLKHTQNALDCFLECVNRLDPIPGSHLFVDPVAPLFIRGDQNKARDVAISMLRFSRLCAERHINISCVAHFGKQKVDPKDQYARPQDRISGSGAFAGFSDTQIYLIDPKPPTEPFHTLGWNPRHAPLEEFRFIRNEHGLFVPYDLYKDLDRVEAVLATVPYEPTRMNALVLRITEATGLAIAQIQRYLSQLVKDGQIVRVSRGVYKRAKPS